MSEYVYHEIDMTKSYRKIFYEHLDPNAWQSKKPSPITYLILALIFLSLIAFSIETEPLISSKYSFELTVINFVIAWLFAIEYFFRLWCCVEDDRYKGLIGRIKFMLTPMAMVDLLAFLPSLILLGATSTYFLRILRVFRLLRLLKLGRYSKSIKVIVSTVKESWYELVVSLGAAFFFLFFGSVVLYFVESNAQPETLGSVLRSLWWAVATLTTVGYGDVYPITVMGKICASVIALIGIAIVAVPTGILASRLMDEHSKQRNGFNHDGN